MPSRSFDKAVHHLLLAGLVEGDGELVAVNLHDMAIAEFLVENAVMKRKLRNRAGGLCHQLALDAIQKRIAARTTVANACTREIVKLCKGSTKETSKSVPCLVTMQGVSRYCLQAMDDAGYR